MNHCVPGWSFEGDQVTNQKKSIGPDHELVELLWQNGQVVLNSQTQRKLNDQPRQIQDDETVSWIHNPFEECLEKEFCSGLFNDLPSLDSFQDDKEPEGDKFVKFSSANPNHIAAPLQQQQPNPMPPPRFQPLGSGSAPRSGSLLGFGSIANLGRVPLSTKFDVRASGGSCAMAQGKVGEGSVMTVGSSHCGSNQVQNDHDLSRVTSSGIGTSGLSARPLKDNLKKTIHEEAIETTLTTSSGFSTEDKRKRSDMEESASQSEAAELESAGGNKSSSRQSRSSKRSRAAEVHNLSERRRRDRINEKMKALQELIPHCSKTDKASMLDEAIEYLKSLQLQLQVMWMGGGMGPMMFPSAQQYMSRMGMSVGMGLPRVPLINQSMSVTQTPNQAMNHVNYSNQMQNQSLAEQYARYLSFHQMQNPTQPMNMNMFRFGSQAMQPSHSVAPSVSSVGAYSGGATTNDALSGKTS